MLNVIWTVASKMSQTIRLWTAAERDKKGVYILKWRKSFEFKIITHFKNSLSDLINCWQEKHTILANARLSILSGNIIVYGEFKKVLNACCAITRCVYFYLNVEKYCLKLISNYKPIRINPLVFVILSRFWSRMDGN